MIAYLVANWKQLGGVAVAAAALGYVAHRPAQPAVHEVASASTAAASKAALDTTTKKGPKSRVVVNFDPDPGAPASTVRVPGVAAPVQVPAGERIEGVSIENDAGSVSDTHATSASQSTSQSHLDLTITPSPRPGWAVGVGLDGLPADRALRISLRRRLFGPFWAEASAVPAQRAVGAALALEW